MTAAFDPILAAVRFGYGLSPHIEPPSSIGQMVSALHGADIAAEQIPIAPFSQATPSHKEYVLLRRQEIHAESEEERAEAHLRVKDWRERASSAGMDGVLRTLARAVTAEDGLRERLTAFWSDHFTTITRSFTFRHLVTPFIEEAIRPHVMSKFEDMLIAVTTHPIMLLALQQDQSVGENSPFGLERGRGLNENLARELLELHTLGVGSAYTQSDVRQLAELLTGLFYHPLQEPRFLEDRAEPGAETVLGKTYAEEASLENIHAVLRDLAVHPSTAQHLSRKLVTHFLSDTPDEMLVGRLAEVYVRTDGDLGDVVIALLEAPEAWTSERKKVRQPFEFIAASMRALGVDAELILSADAQSVNRLLHRPLRVMGQPWQTPVGPDGWPEDAGHWIIPQAMAGRIGWAMQAPKMIVAQLPDPRRFVEMALGPNPPAEVRFAASAAETRAEGVGVVLASPAFQRR